jgi:hypothetical protein
VVMDPRTAAIGVTAADLAEQEELALAVRDLLSRARRLRADVETALETAAGSERDGLARLHRELTARDDVSYPQPMLVEQIEYLYGMVADAPQKPGRDAFQRYDELVAELEALEARR